MAHRQRRFHNDIVCQLIMRHARVMAVGVVGAANAHNPSRIPLICFLHWVPWGRTLSLLALHWNTFLYSDDTAYNNIIPGGLFCSFCCCCCCYMVIQLYITHCEDEPPLHHSPWLWPLLLWCVSKSEPSTVWTYTKKWSRISLMTFAGVIMDVFKLL